MKVEILAGGGIKTAFKEALKECNLGDTVLVVDSQELARATNKGNKLIDRRYSLVTV